MHARVNTTRVELAGAYARVTVIDRDDVQLLLMPAAGTALQPQQVER